MFLKSHHNLTEICDSENKSKLRQGDALKTSRWQVTTYTDNDPI